MTKTNPYEEMTTPEALRWLARRYLRKPECIALVEKAALEIEAARELVNQVNQLITPKGNFEITEHELHLQGDTCNVSEHQYIMVKMHSYNPQRFDQYADPVGDLPFTEAFRKVQFGGQDTDN